MELRFIIKFYPKRFDFLSDCIKIIFIMKTTTWKSNSILMLTAFIWGFAFVAQRVGMAYIGPFTFNAIRFALGSLFLLPILLINNQYHLISKNSLPPVSRKTAVFIGSAIGLILFIGTSFQQVGLVYTTAGKAGFITGLYVVLVPILGLFWNQQTSLGTWLGAVSTTVGLYFLTISDNFTINFGDFLVFIGAFFWAGHVQIIGKFSSQIDSLKLAILQFTICSGLSLITAMLTEVITIQAIHLAMPAILYGGLLSVGIAFTLQIIGQRDAHPAHAAIIMSMETIFAVIGGWFILGETLSPRGLLGCLLMFVGMLLSQLNITAKFLFPQTSEN